MEDLYNDALDSPWIHPNAPDWGELIKFAEKRVVKKNTILVDMGDVVDTLYYLHKGQVKLSFTTRSGMEKTVWYTNSPGVFGETPFFHNQPCKFIISASKDCEFYSFKKEVLLGELANHPEIMKFILELLAQKVRVISTQLEDLTFKEPVVRVANLLYMVVCQNGKQIDKNSYSVDIRLTHQEIANITGLHRVTASNAIKKLYDDGLITKSRSSIVIPNIKLLKDLISS